MMRDMEQQIQDDLWAVRDWPHVRVDDAYRSAMRRLAFDVPELVARLISAEEKLAAVAETAERIKVGTMDPQTQREVWLELRSILEGRYAPPAVNTTPE